MGKALLLLYDDKPFQPSPTAVTSPDIQWTPQRLDCFLPQDDLDARYDLILIAVHSLTPHMLERCSALRAAFTGPLLMVTEPVEEESVVRAYVAGVDECILKPISSALLMAKIAAWLRWSKS
jgi:DNA-binding response OmpR family regulator